MRTREAPLLRQRAEERLRDGPCPGGGEALLPEAAQRTLHELRVHQIELEMQNDELCQSQAALEVARARNVALYDLAPAGYCTLGERGQILEANLSAATLLGVPRRRLIGQTISRFLGREDADRFHLQRRQLIETGEPLACELRIRQAEGSAFWAQVSAITAPVADGTPGVYLVLVDVTARKQGEIELRRHRDHLDALVQERTDELVSARDVAEAANRAKTTFLSTMSHELRTPMTGVMGMIELAGRRTNDAKTRVYLAKALDSAKLLLAIINDILDLSRIEADRLVLESQGFTLAALLGQLLSLEEPLARAKGIALRVDIAQPLAELVLLGDALRLGQIFLNLIGNAVKFTCAGTVSVRLTAHEEPGDEVRLRCEVEDSGIGISAAEQQRLFHPFAQADSSMTRRYGGSGLGLAISRRLAQLMGGDIGVASEPGVGSVFWCTVGLRKGQVEGGPASVATGLSGEEILRTRHRGRRILLVEDEAMARDVARSLLEQVGLVVDSAEDGVQAVALAEGNAYDLILMDLSMPKLDGLEATRTIRRLPACAQLPIVALTACAFGDDRQRCLAAGMNDHLAKPVVPGRLFDTLAAWLERGS